MNVKRKKPIASIARFPNINQQLASQKDHPNLPASRHYRRTQSIPPVATLRHTTEGYERKYQRRRKKDGRNHLVNAKFQKRYIPDDAREKHPPGARFQIVTEQDQFKWDVQSQ